MPKTPKAIKVEVLRALSSKGSEAVPRRPSISTNSSLASAKGDVSQSGGGLLLQSPNDGVRVVGDYRQQHLGGAIGTMGALLPVPHGSKRQAEARREFFLREVHPQPERP